VKTLRIAELLAWGLGVALLTSYGAVRVHGQVMQERALQAFDSVADTTVDFSLWSEGRIDAYRDTPVDQDRVPLAVLRIPGIDLEVPVFDGTDELTLNRAVGRIAGTARPGEAGNLGIAGHRDGFFRGLKDVSIGDEIELQTLTGTQRYAVTEITVTTPSDVEVLDPTDDPSITLVTCYPFYFVGSAPQRYIVRATRQAGLSDSNQEHAEPGHRPVEKGRSQ
jgi:sortase A